jgi:tetratricopeptide (TPR) repeat protein
MRRKASLLVMASSLFLGSQLSAQSIVVKPDREPKPNVAALENKEKRANRTQSVEEVRTMPDRVLRFQDSEVKIKTIILLADMLWGKGQDEPGARLLFLKADELIRSVRISKTDNPASRDDVAAVGPSVLRSLKGLLVQRVSLHDASLGQRLSRGYGLETLSPSDIASLDNNEVSALIRQGQLASATKSLHGMIDDSLSGRRSLLSFLSLLFALRAQDGQVADKLFIDATLRMSEQPNVTADNVLIIGNYLFAARHLDVKLLTAPQVFISPITLGDVVLQADVSQVRPGISAAATRAYIGAATQIMERPSYDLDETKRRAAAAFLLLPHAQLLAPEFAPQLLSIQRRAGIDLSQPSRPDSLPLTDNGKVDLDLVLESVDAIPTSRLRDQYILRTVRILYLKGDLDAALALAEKSSDLISRNQVVSVITFAQAVKSLEAGQIESAQKSLTSVTSSLQRFLLRLGLARQYLRQHDEHGAEALLTDAINDIRDHGAEFQQPYLILSAVEMLASCDLRAATDRLRDAIKAFNALDGPRKSRVAPNFSETISVGDSSVAFPLRISGVKYGSLAATLKSLSSDPQGVRAVLFELRDESMLSEGMLALANTLLG